MLLDFSKMHGLGNDFMLLDLVTQPTTHDLAALQDLLRELDRA